MTVRVLEEFGDDNVRQRLKLVGVEAAPEHETFPVQPRPPKTQPTRDAEMIELMATVARILGFRAQLLLAFLAAAGLASVAVWQQTTLALVAAGMFNLMVFLPVLYAAFRRG